MATANPTDLADGDIVSETWVDAVAQHVVRTYSSTAARDAELTDPHTGQWVYVTSNDVNEGPWIYTSAGTWRRPWSMGQGVVPASSGGTGGMAISSTTTASSTVTTTETTVATSPTFAAVANRIYKVTCIGTTIGTVTGDLFNLQIRQTNSSGTSHFDQKLTTIGASVQTPFTIVCFVTGLTAGSQLFVLTFQRQAGTGNLGTLSGSKLHWMIEDVGPAGIPA